MDEKVGETLKKTSEVSYIDINFSPFCRLERVFGSKLYAAVTFTEK